MNSINKTLYIPLYGKAYVSQKGLFLVDKKAEEIWQEEGFALRGKSKSKWLAYYMGIRSAVFDEWLAQQMTNAPKAAVIHIGCGMDSRCIRVGAENRKWYDVDFPEVIKERKHYYGETDSYKMISGDVRDSEWLKAIEEKEEAIVVMEGVSMYLTAREMRELNDRICSHFDCVTLLVDAYTTLAAKMSRRRNPINSVGVTEVYGIDSPQDYRCDGLDFVKEQEMTPRKYINELSGLERLIFSKLYAGGFSKKLYRLFEYEKK